MKNKSILFLLIFSLFCKLLLAYFVPVFGDEAYYYIWSLHPQLSYFDHPAMVSWFIYLGHLFFPAGNPLALRISFVIASFLTLIVWIKILQLKKINEYVVFFVLLLFLLNPLLGVGSVLATPDTALVLFWSLSYYCFLRLLQSHHLRWYALLGAGLGLGFCSKYHIVLFVFSGLLYLIFTKKFRQLHLKGVLTTLVFGAAFSAPVIIWNAQNQWSSFLFQMNHGFGESGFEWAWPTGYLVAQLFIISPFVFFTLFKKSEENLDKTFSLSQLGFFFLSSFKSVVEGNWPLTSHLHSITHFCSTASRRAIKFSIYYFIGIYVLFAIFLTLPASRAVKKNLVNSAQLEEIAKLTDTYQPLYGASYQVASLLAWKTQKNIPKLNSLSRFDFYDTLPESNPTEAKFYVLKYDYSNWPEKYGAYKKIKIQSFDNVGIELYQFNHE